MTGWDDPAPGEREAGDRSWNVVRNAYEERIRVPRKRDWRPIAIAAAAAVVVAGAVTPPADGAWVVQNDGSKRLLDGYRNASWSPHGLFLAATRGDELRALEPSGKVHWSIGRLGRIRNPRWSFDGFRVAYFAARFGSSTATATATAITCSRVTFDQARPRGNRTNMP